MEFGTPFRNLPLHLRRRWWRATNYGERRVSGELMLLIEMLLIEVATNPEAAEYLAHQLRRALAIEEMPK